jgi:hypothetical protein
MSNEFLRLSRRITWTFIAGVILAPFTAVVPAFAQLSKSYTATLLDVAQLPRLRPIAKMGFFSSYDRSGGNDDGVSGKYSFLRKENDGLVIAEVKGPGALTRIWTPTWTRAAMEVPVAFYFDGEKDPRLVLPLKDLFSGQRKPFVGELVGHGLGGYYSYVPLEFAKSIKVVVRAKQFNFYEINYSIYQPGVPVRTFQPTDAFQSPTVKPEGALVSRTSSLAPGNTITIFETEKPGRIESLKLGPAGAFAGPNRDIVLRITWDGAAHPAVDVPVGDLFGYSFGHPAMQSLLLGTENGWDYIRFPMPFERSARIELVSQRSGGEPLQVHSEIIVSARGKAADEGTFHAEWRRENPTKSGEPFTYVDVSGRGHLVGAILQAQGPQPGQTDFFEGNEGATVDGQVAMIGTGSEDSFNGGWWGIPGRWSQRGSLPLSGCLDYSLPTARTGGYRFYIADAYSFQHTLRHTIDHYPEGSENIPTDYVGTSFYYLNRPDGTPAALLNVSERAVQEPESFVLDLVGTPEVVALRLASLTTSGANYLNADKLPFVTFARDASWSEADDPDSLAHSKSDPFDAPIGSSVMVVRVNAPLSGLYAISVEGLTGPNAARLQLAENDEPIGVAVDFYSSERRRSGEQKLGEIHLAEGENLLYLMLPGRNPQSTGIGVDLIRIKGTRVH